MGVMQRASDPQLTGQEKCERKLQCKIAKEILDGRVVQQLLGVKAGPALAGAGYAKAGALVCTGFLPKAGTVVAATALGPVGIGILGGVAVAGLMLGVWNFLVTKAKFPQALRPLPRFRLDVVSKSRGNELNLLTTKEIKPWVPFCELP